MFARIFVWKVFTATFLIVGLAQAQAGLMVEPYAGYETGTISYKAGGADETFTDKTAGFAMGGRVGYSFLLPWVALDVGMFSGKDTPDSRTGDPTADVTETLLFLTGGADLPVGLRGYVGYGFYDKATLSSGGTDTVYTGSAYKIGIGFKVIPMVSANLEYVTHSFSKVKSGSAAEVSVSDLYNSFSYSHVFIGASVPLSL